MGVPGKVSETAIATASLRALSNYEDEVKFRTNDHLAEHFLPDEKRIPLQDPKVRSQIKKAIPEGLYEYVIARTKYFDSCFDDAVPLGFRQIVLLGAGFDSRPYRLGEKLSGVRVFEVDARETQEYKLGALRSHNVRIPTNVIYVALDLESEALFEELHKFDYHDESKTIFQLEGVSFYLEKRTVKTLLESIYKNSCVGTRICLDFQTVGLDRKLVETGLRDESIKFGIDGNEIEGFFSKLNYRIIDLCDSTEIERRFMVKEDGCSFGKISPILNIVTLEK